MFLPVPTLSPPTVFRPHPQEDPACNADRALPDMEVALSPRRLSASRATTDRGLTSAAITTKRGRAAPSSRCCGSAPARRWSSRLRPSWRTFACGVLEEVRSVRARLREAGRQASGRRETRGGQAPPRGGFDLLEGVRLKLRIAAMRREAVSLGSAVEGVRTRIGSRLWQVSAGPRRKATSKQVRQRTGGGSPRRGRLPPAG